MSNNDKKVNGRRALLQMLDVLVAEESNIKAFRNAFQEQIDAEPMRFFQNIVMPLMPKKDVDDDGDEEEKEQRITIQFVPAPPPEELKKESKETKESEG